MSLYADNKMTKLNFYNGLKEIEKYQMEMSMYKLNNVPDIAKEYTSSVADTAFFSQQVAKKLMKYLDSGKTSDLSAAQEEIQRVKDSILVIGNNRAVVLKQAGFTPEEIKAIAEEQ